MVAFAFLLALATTAPKPLVVTKQPTAPIKLSVGQKLQFYIIGNPSTGAEWLVAKSGAPGLKYLGIVEEQLKRTDPPVVGQPEHFTLTFQAMKKGKYPLLLNYGRIWEIKKGQKPWGTLKATVIVR